MATILSLKGDRFDVMIEMAEKWFDQDGNVAANVARQDGVFSVNMYG